MCVLDIRFLLLRTFNQLKEFRISSTRKYVEQNAINARKKIVTLSYFVFVPTRYAVHAAAITEQKIVIFIFPPKFICLEFTVQHLLYHIIYNFSNMNPFYP